ncbi:MAG TPA: alpha/beta hydrolase [Thermoleophilaceae bacterium]|nr:alpha/beta hydrolase [Thermoleophilaceae bacterium]
MNNISLPYVEQGDASGVPVLLLHGATDSWRAFEPVLRFLPDDIHAIAVTQRGHGDAPKPETGYAIDDLAADVVPLLDRLGLGQVVLVGHSLGSLVASRVAIDNPERLAGLILGGAFGHPLSANPALEGVEAFTALEDPIPREVPYEFQSSTLTRPLPDGMLDGFVDESMKVPAHVWRGIFENVPRVDLSDELGAITASTLVIQGSEDVYVAPSDSDMLLDAIPDARLIVYQGAGHAFHWEEPERFAADVAEFSRYSAGLQLSR